MAANTSYKYDWTRENITTDFKRCKYYDEPSGQCYESDQDLLNNIYDYLELTSLEWIISVIYILVFVTGVGGNFLVGYAVWRNKYLRTITNFFLTNLAVADFLTIVFCLPPSFAQTIFETWFLGNVMCKTVIYLQISFCVMLPTPMNINLGKMARDLVQ